MEELDRQLTADDKAEITKKVWSLVDALPQRDLIEVSDARQWIGRVVELHGEQAIWHAIRLNGFGGSKSAFWCATSTAFVPTTWPAPTTSCWAS